LLTTDDVAPGVAQMIPMLYIECMFAEGTKVMAVFEPIALSNTPAADDLVPGEIIAGGENIESFADLPAITIEVINTGDRDVQVRSHTHFFEVNRALRFDRAAAWGMKIDRPAGAGVRFEPGVTKSVRLVPISGDRVVLGQAGLVNGPLDVPSARDDALKHARARGYQGA
jgi:urease subunit gamma/beta